MQRGDIVLLDFPFSSGTGAKVRPAVIVQCDSNNRRLQTTIVAMVTSSVRLAKAEPTQMLVDPATPTGAPSGLLHASAIKCENLFTIVQNRILRTIGRLDPIQLANLDSCLEASLELK